MHGRRTKQLKLSCIGYVHADNETEKYRQGSEAHCQGERKRVRQRPNRRERERDRTDENSQETCREEARKDGRDGNKTKSG